MAEVSSEQLKDAHAQRISGNYDEALALYQGVLEGAPDLAEALWGLGLVQMNIGEFDDALEALGRAVDLEETPKHLLDLGKLQTMLGMFDEAKPVFERVVELDGSSREADDARNQLRYY